MSPSPAARSEMAVVVAGAVRFVVAAAARFVVAVVVASASRFVAAARGEV